MQIDKQIYWPVRYRGRRQESEISTGSSDIAIPSERNIRTKEYEKLEKYQGLKQELRRMWKMKSRVILLIIGMWLPS